MSKQMKTLPPYVIPILIFLAFIAFAVVAWELTIWATAWDVGTRIGALSVVLALLGVIVALFAPSFQAWYAKHSGSPTEQDLESVRTQLLSAILSARIERGTGDVQRTQLESMVPGSMIKLKLETVHPSTGPPDGLRKLDLNLPIRAFEDLVAQWSAEPHRLVLVGETGSGKTVAALRLCEAVNLAAKDHGSRIAEIFSLAEWSSWQLAHTNAGMSDWFLSQLSDRYAVAPRQAQRLIDNDKLIPILDGLDEVPDSERRDCLEQLTRYARKVAKHRPFVLVARASEYRELAPNWIEADQTLILLPLDTTAMLSALDDVRLNNPGWEEVRAAVASGNKKLTALLSTPLRLSTALGVLRDRDPSMLTDEEIPDKMNLLWEMKFSGERSLGSTVDDRHMSNRGLLWLGSAMKQQDKQVFWLHDLYLYAPRRPKTFNVFRFVVFALGSASLTYVVWRDYEALKAARVFRFTHGPLYAIYVLLTAPLFLVSTVFWAANLSIKEKPSAGLLRAHLSKKSEALRLLRRKLCRSFATSAGLGVFAAASLAFRETDISVSIEVAVVIMVLGGLGLGAISYLRALSPLADGSDIGVRGPMDLIVASAKTGILLGVIGALVIGAVIGVPTGVLVARDAFRYRLPNGSTIHYRLNSPYGIEVGLRVGALGAAVAAYFLTMVFGLDAFIYHYVVRLKLRSLGFPGRIETYLDWCADERRGWIRRVGGTYEFCDREFQKYLAARHDSLKSGQTPRRCARTQ